MALDGVAWVALGVSILVGSLVMWAIGCRADRLWLAVAAPWARYRLKPSSGTAGRGTENSPKHPMSRFDRCVVLTGTCGAAACLLAPTITIVVIVATHGNTAVGPALLAVAAAIITAYSILTWHARDWVLGLKPVAPTTLGKWLHHTFASVRAALAAAAVLFVMYLLWAVFRRTAVPFVAISWVFGCLSAIPAIVTVYTAAEVRPPTLPSHNSNEAQSGVALEHDLVWKEAVARLAIQTSPWRGWLRYGALYTYVASLAAYALTVKFVWTGTDAGPNDGFWNALEMVVFDAVIVATSVRYMQGRPLLCSSLVVLSRLVLAGMPQEWWFVGHAVLYLLVGSAIRMQSWANLIPYENMLLNDPRFSVARSTDNARNVVPWASIFNEFSVSVGVLALFVMETLFVAVLDHHLATFESHEQAEVGVAAILAVETVSTLYAARRQSIQALVRWDDLIKATWRLAHAQHSADGSPQRALGNNGSAAVQEALQRAGQDVDIRYLRAIYLIAASWLWYLAGVALWSAPREEWDLLVTLALGGTGVVGLIAWRECWRSNDHRTLWFAPVFKDGPWRYRVVWTMVALLVVSLACLGVAAWRQESLTTIPWASAFIGIAAALVAYIGGVAFLYRQDRRSLWVSAPLAAGLWLLAVVLEWDDHGWVLDEWFFGVSAVPVAVLLLGLAVVSWVVDGGTLSVTTAVLVAVAQGIPLVSAVWWAIDSVTDVGWIMGVCALVAVIGVVGTAAYVVHSGHGRLVAWLGPLAASIATATAVAVDEVEETHSIEIISVGAVCLVASMAGFGLHALYGRGEADLYGSAYVFPVVMVDAKFGTYRLQNAGPLYVYGSLGVIMLWGAWMTVALEDNSVHVGVGASATAALVLAMVLLHRARYPRVAARSAARTALLADARVHSVIQDVNSRVSSFRRHMLLPFGDKWVDAGEEESKGDAESKGEVADEAGPATREAAAGVSGDTHDADDAEVPYQDWFGLAVVNSYIAAGQLAWGVRVGASSADGHLLSSSTKQPWWRVVDVDGMTYEDIIEAEEAANEQFRLFGKHRDFILLFEKASIDNLNATWGRAEAELRRFAAALAKQRFTGKEAPGLQRSDEELLDHLARRGVSLETAIVTWPDDQLRKLISCMATWRRAVLMADRNTLMSHAADALKTLRKQAARRRRWVLAGGAAADGRNPGDGAPANAAADGGTPHLFHEPSLRQVHADDGEHKSPSGEMFNGGWVVALDNGDDLTRIPNDEHRPQRTRLISPHHVSQGDLNNCWLISALQLLAQSEQNWRWTNQLAVNDDAGDGLIHAHVCIGGKWIKFTANTSLPVKKGTTDLLYARPPDGLSPVPLWAPFAERIMAAAYGGYGELDFGYFHVGMEELTGGVGAATVVPEPQNTATRLWDTWLDTYARDGYLLAAQTPPQSSASQDQVLSPSHVYSIVRVLRLPTESTPDSGDGQRLIIVRDPRGKLQDAIDANDVGKVDPKDCWWAGLEGFKSVDKLPDEERVAVLYGSDGRLCLTVGDFISQFAVVFQCRPAIGRSVAHSNPQPLYTYVVRSLWRHDDVKDGIKARAMPQFSFRLAATVNWLAAREVVISFSIVQQSGQTETRSVAAGNQVRRVWGPIGLHVFEATSSARPPSSAKQTKPADTVSNTLLSTQVNWWPQASVVYDASLATKSPLQPAARINTGGRCYNVMAVTEPASANCFTQNEFELTIVSNKPLDLSSVGHGFGWRLQRVTKMPTGAAAKPLPEPQWFGSEESGTYDYRLLPVDENESWDADAMDEAQQSWLNYEPMKEYTTKLAKQGRPRPAKPGGSG